MIGRTHASLKGTGVVFKGMNVSAEITETLATVSVTQHYTNETNSNVEAIYTFPLPVDAVLLDIKITIGIKTLVGQITPKKIAEDAYEDAIYKGDTPIMIENPEPGIYTVNLGNLLAGESASINFSYGIFLHWQDDNLRFSLPTTISPRYRNEPNSYLGYHREPETNLLIENVYSLTIDITGRLAKAALTSPSHNILIERNDSSTTVCLKTGHAMMDRDFVLNIKSPESDKSAAVLTKDGDEYLLWCSLAPIIPGSKEKESRSIKILIDCSGSMAGESISQAKDALLKILDTITSNDYFNIIAFGTFTRIFHNEQLQATRRNIRLAREFIGELDAYMGGTEIDKALHQSYMIKGPAGISPDILLITDGQIENWQHIVHNANISGHRIFSIGVGNSVAEGFVREIARQSHGASEFVVPREGMSDTISRHFKRIYTPQIKDLKINWPLNPTRIFPQEPYTIFDGDTFNIFCWFDRMPTEGTILLYNDETPYNSIAVPNQLTQKNSDITRMAAARTLRCVYDDVMGSELAVKYGLLTKWTNCFVVLQRPENKKCGTSPKLIKVHQMLSAGWGGSGNIVDEIGCEECFDFTEVFLLDNIDGYLNTDRFSPREFVDILNDDRFFYSDHISFDHLIVLVNNSLPRLMLNLVTKLRCQYGKHIGLVLFLILISQSTAGKRLKHAIRLEIDKLSQKYRISKDMVSGAEKLIGKLTLNRWGESRSFFDDFDGKLNPKRFVCKINRLSNWLFEKESFLLLILIYEDVPSSIKRKLDELINSTNQYTALILFLYALAELPAGKGLYKKVLNEINKSYRELSPKTEVVDKAKSMLEGITETSWGVSL